MFMMYTESFLSTCLLPEALPENVEVASLCASIRGNMAQYIVINMSPDDILLISHYSILLPTGLLSKD